MSEEFYHLNVTISWKGDSTYCLGIFTTKEKMIDYMVSYHSVKEKRSHDNILSCMEYTKKNKDYTPNTLLIISDDGVAYNYSYNLKPLYVPVIDPVFK